jgi:hypothetical protein
MATERGSANCKAAFNREGFADWMERIICTPDTPPSVLKASVSPGRGLFFAELTLLFRHRLQQAALLSLSDPCAPNLKALGKAGQLAGALSCQSELV